MSRDATADRLEGTSGSARVDAGGLSWGVEWSGSGPPLLLLHGTGATRASWRWLLPFLTPHARCVAIDLPGHGETGTPGFDRITLDAMAESVHTLLDALAFSPAVVVSHSAGAAIMLRLATLGALSRDALLIGINPALEPPAAAARFVMAGPLGAMLRSRAARALVREAGQFGSMIELLLASTGSRLTPEQEQEYTRAFQQRDHAEAAYAMMANWDLWPLVRALPALTQRTHFIVGARDQWVPPRVADDAAARMPHASVARIADAGHLVHEERPGAVAELVLTWMKESRRSPEHGMEES